MKTLDRYVLRELFVPFLIGTVGLVLMFQANFLIALLKTYSAQNLPPLAIFQLIWFKTPEFMKFTLPCGMALATALAMSRLVRESELTAIRSVGTPIRRVMMPLILSGIAVSLLNFYLIERVQPWAEGRSREVMQKANLLGLAPEFASNVMIKVGTRGVAYFGAVQRNARGTLDLFDVIYIEPRGDGRMLVVNAARGLFDKGNFTFPNAYSRVLRNDLLESYRAEEFRFFERMTTENLVNAPTAVEMNFEKLQEEIKTQKRLGNNVRMLEVELHNRVAIPVACLVFSLTGPVLAVMLSRGGGFMGVFLSLVLVVAYYNVFVVSNEIFGRNGWFAPAVAAWFPNVLFFAIGLLVARRLE